VRDKIGGDLAERSVLLGLSYNANLRIMDPGVMRDASGRNTVLERTGETELAH